MDELGMRMCRYVHNCVCVYVCLQSQQVNHRRPPSLLTEQLIELQSHPLGQSASVEKLSTVLLLNLRRLTQREDGGK